MSTKLINTCIQSVLLIYKYFELQKINFNGLCINDFTHGEIVVGQNNSQLTHFTFKDS
jgi:hypothetical protein